MALPQAIVPFPRLRGKARMGAKLCEILPLSLSPLPPPQPSPALPAREGVTRTNKEAFLRYLKGYSDVLRT